MRSVGCGAAQLRASWERHSTKGELPVTYSADTIQRVTATLAAVNAHYPVAGSGGELLTLTNPKVAKGAAERGYLPAVLHLAPSTMAGANLCPWSSAECAAGCLNTSGRGGIGLDASGWNVIQAARIRRAAFLILNPEGFAEKLRAEVAAHVKRAERHGLRPALRLNGTSDVAWHRAAPSILDYATQRGVRLYDYTKRPKPDAAAHGIDLTYSYPGGEGNAARRYLAAGHRVAVVFATRKAQALPTEWRSPWGDTFRVIDGDASDLRFLDPSGVVVGLRAKGKLRGVAGSARGFVQVAA